MYEGWLPRAGALALTAWLVAGTAASQAQLPLEPIRDVGQGVTAAYEGWYRNADGSFTLLVGYFNRNEERRSTFPSVRTIASSRATPIRASQRISFHGANGACSRSRSRPISATRR